MGHEPTPPPTDLRAAAAYVVDGGTPRGNRQTVLHWDTNPHKPASPAAQLKVCRRRVFVGSQRRTVVLCYGACHFEYRCPCHRPKSLDALLTFRFSAFQRGGRKRVTRSVVSRAISVRWKDRELLENWRMVRFVLADSRRLFCGTGATVARAVRVVNALLHAPYLGIL